MSVTSSDIVVYASQNMPEDDTTISGGAIDSGVRVVFTDIVATDTIQATGSASDSGTLTITGRNAAGAVVTESLGLSGTTIVSGTQSFERILKVFNDEAASGTITLQDATTDANIGSIYANESGFRRPYYGATANAVGGGDKTLYEKVFVANNNSVNALLSTSIAEVSSGLYTNIDFALESTIKDTTSATDRTTAPTGVGIYGVGPSGIPGTDLNPLEYEGMWLKFSLTAGTAAANSYYQFTVDGSST